MPISQYSGFEFNWNGLGSLEVGHKHLTINKYNSMLMGMLYIYKMYIYY